MKLELNYRDKYKEGEKAGKTSEKIGSAKRMLKLNKYSIEEISDITELSIAEIKSLQEQIQIYEINLCLTHSIKGCTIEKKFKEKLIC